MQAAYPARMPLDSPIKAIRRANLASIASGTNAVSYTELARLLGKPKMRSHLSNIAAGDKGMGDKLAAAIEAALRYPRGWMDRQHPSSGEAHPTYDVAHSASHEPLSHDLPLLSREDIMRKPVPPIFRSVLEDDALAPEHPVGTEIVWTTRRRPAPGRLLLLRDRHGQLHARLCHQGRAPGQWIAAPTNPAFLSFDSQEEGVVLLAVFKGRLEPDD